MGFSKSHYDQEAFEIRRHVGMDAEIFGLGW
jgi:hypothetical protein